MFPWSRLLFPAGLLLLAHGAFLAVGTRPAGGGETTTAAYFPMAGGTGHVGPATVPVLLELLLGVVISIFGYVKQSSFKRARLIDKNCHQRYDDIMFAGMGLMNFNHRGAVVCSQLDKTTDSSVPDLAAKKKT